MKKEKLLVRKSALEKMLKNIESIKIVGNIKSHNIKYYQSLYDYAVDLTILEILTLLEFDEVIKSLEDWKIDYLLGCPLSAKKSWLLIEIIKVDKKLRRKEKLSNFFGFGKRLLFYK